MIELIEGGVEKLLRVNFLIQKLKLSDKDLMNFKSFHKSVRLIVILAPMAFSLLSCLPLDSSFSAANQSSTAPTPFAFTSNSTFSTTTGSVTYTGTCDSSMSVTVSGGASTTTPCQNGIWSFTATATLAGSYAYTFSQGDNNLQGSWQKSVVLVTSDSLLNAGTANSFSDAAPSGNSIAIIQSSANPSNWLWELDPDPWGTSSGSGTIAMTYSGSGSIVSTVNLTGLNITPVNAYPFIFYGADVYGYRTLGQPPQFPAQLASMSSLIFDVNYSLVGTFAGTIDVLFDEWLMPSSTYSSGGSGAVEVEILPYCSGFYPAGTFVKTFTVSMTVNGVVTSQSFSEYASGTGAGTDVLFYPATAPGIMSGEIRFNALDFLQEAAATAGLNSSWWVAGFDFGNEFGDSATQNFTFTVNKVDIEQTLTSQ